ncbi:serine/arginine repetitive matrix-like protein [Perilla frutescens var. frutescens]|nr:serine/arginine repetitive matrix-like protein [Perilla frutescens var. frutescens]
MNRTLRESVIGAARSVPLSHRRGHSINGHPNSNDDNLDLFSKSRRSLSVASSDESDVSVKLGRLSLGSAKQGKSGLDDLLSSADGGKHDYDWLLTPPGTPLVPVDGSEAQTGLMAPRSGPLVRSISTTKTSRLSVSHSETNHVTKPARSSSVTRPSVSSSHYSSYSNKSTNILNTSSASVSSYIRPSTPTNRSSSSTRPSTPSARSSVSRSSTPSKPRPALSTTSSIDRPRGTQNSRPSTPTSRPQISANLNSPAPRTTSRPSTPTRRNSTPSYSPVSGPSTPGGRSLTNGKSATSVSRPSSPGPRVRAPPQPIVLPDFSLETPPNLRTTLPDRPISAGRSRPGVALTAKGNVEPTINSASVPRRQSSPVVTRGRLTEPAGRSRTLSNGSLNDAADSRRELSARKPTKAASTDSTGFGRTISKKSLDMAIRHMDIRNGGSNGFRPVTGSNLFPQSIRSSNQKMGNGNLSRNGNGGGNSITENGHHHRFSESGSEEDRNCAKLSNVDIYESSRYDMILLKEDLKNTNWLHSIDDKSEQGSLFDHGFELLPEPFHPL